MWVLRSWLGTIITATGMISPRPQSVLGKWSVVSWSNVSWYICLHISRHLPRAQRIALA